MTGGFGRGTNGSPRRKPGQAAQRSRDNNAVSRRFPPLAPIMLPRALAASNCSLAGGAASWWTIVAGDIAVSVQFVSTAGRSYIPASAARRRCISIRRNSRISTTSLSRLSIGVDRAPYVAPNLVLTESQNGMATQPVG